MFRTWTGEQGQRYLESAHKYYFETTILDKITESKWTERRTI